MSDQDTNREILTQLRHLVANQPTTFEQGGSGGRGRSSEIETTVNDILGEVLGTQIRTDDVRSLNASLENVFAFAYEDGHRVVRWQRPSYAIQTDLGASFTGERASFYSYALTQAEEIRKRVRVLRSPIDHGNDDRMTAARAGWLLELDDFMDTLGREVNLRPLLLDGALDQLDNYATQAELAFGVDKNSYKDNIQTVEDARLVSEFQTAVRFQKGIRDAWTDYKLVHGLPSMPPRPTDPDPGNAAVEVPMILMRLTPLLAAVTENVRQEFYGGLNALAFSAMDRQVFELQILQQRISVAELFDWVLRFSSSKAPRVLKFAGRVGLPNLKAEVDLLEQLVEQTLTQTEAGQTTVPFKFTHPRITDALKVIHDLLERIYDEVQL